MSRSPTTHSCRSYLCVYFPEWAIDATRRKLLAQQPPHTPTAIMLTTTHAQHVVVARPCRFSRRAGVRPTMTLSLAKALVDTDVHCEEYDPVRDVEALYTLAVWCLRFSPLVGLDTELHNARLRGEASTISPSTMESQ